MAEAPPTASSGQAGRRRRRWEGVAKGRQQVGRWVAAEYRLNTVTLFGTTKCDATDRHAMPCNAMKYYETT